VTTTKFGQVLHRHGLELRRGRLEILQVNVGKLCNQTCMHCHVGAGPGRSEIMSAETADRVLAWIERHRPGTVDLTGGAPELCPEFRRLAAGARATGARVLVRCNLTILLEPGQEDLGAFYREHRLDVIASLPCYLEENVDGQRGEGVYRKSIEALRRLNALGYGIEDEYRLDLIYNPTGPSVAPAQGPLEQAYKRELFERFGLRFHRLYCLTNLPITRFKLYLQRTGQLESYHRLLLESFNPATVAGLMCRDTLSVGWQGDLFDCDFNQMLDLPLGGVPRRFLWDVDPDGIEGEPVPTGAHCFGCTAGAGSSCGGALT